MTGLTSPKFIITTSYGTVSMFTYLITLYVILRKPKVFSGSFFKLQIVITIVNVWTYLNSFITLRFPQNTCYNCTLAPMFTHGHFFGLEFYTLLHFHFGYVQYFMSLIVAINRFVIILLSQRFKKLWNRLQPLFAAVEIFSPLIVTHIMLLGATGWAYVPELDYYKFTTTANRLYIYQVLIVFMVCSTSTTLILNFIVIKAFLTGHLSTSSTAKAEIKLFLNSAITLVIEICATITTVLNATADPASSTAVLAQTLLPFVSDALTLLPPFILLSTSRVLRRAIVERCLGRLFSVQTSSAQTWASKSSR